MKTFLRLTFATIFTSTLILGFYACSSDDNETNDGAKAKLLPIKITLVEANGDLYAESVLTYNDNNQLIRSKYENGELIDFKYDVEGRLKAAGDDTYIYENNTVHFKRTDVNDPDNTDYTLNENGVLKSSLFLYDNVQYFYEFDKNGNLTKQTNKEGKIILNPAYSTYLSPFCNMNMPSFFMLFDDIWGIQATGLNMPITFDENSYKVIESESNYPTKVEQRNEEGVLKFIYTITYKKIK